MHTLKTLVSVLCLTLGLGSPNPLAPAALSLAEQDILKTLVGSWEGHCKTWFEEGRLADESDIKGEFRPLLGGRLLRYSYSSTMLGKPRSGEETLAFNTVDKEYQSSWFDEFHMNYGLLFSTGTKTEAGFAVTGSYGVGVGQRPWGWRTEYELIDTDLLMITAINISPDGLEEKAIETVYSRVKTESK